MIAASKKTFNPGKILLLAAGLTSSCFIGFWMYATMPEGFPSTLRWVVAIVSAIVFDGIVTYTAFSRLQDKWNFFTRMTAVFGGVLVTLALFYGFHWAWLHAIFIVLGAMFAHFISLEVASIRKETNELERLKNEVIRINETYQTDLTIERQKVDTLSSELETTKAALVEAKDRDSILERLAETDLTQEAIYKIMRGNRNAVCKRVRELREEK